MVVDVIDDVELALEKIVHVHRQIIAEYETLFALVEGSNLNIQILRQHRKQMTKMTADLSAQSTRSDAEDQRHVSMAH